jgi:serine/arginine repetitive matrix protein 2
MEYQLAKTAAQPVKKKKKKVAPGAAEGSHLQSGTMTTGKPAVAPQFETAQEPAVQPNVERPLQPPIKKKKKKNVPVGETAHLAAVDSSPRTDSDSDSNVEKKVDSRRAQRASGVLNKQPSIVREDWEGEQEETTPIQARSAQVEPIQEEASPMHKPPANAANVSKKIGEPAASPLSAQPKYFEPLVERVGNAAEESPASSSLLQVTEPQSTRGTSLSPSRSTRFSDRLASDLAAGQKHEPPPRSVSPAKPALKHHGDGMHARGSSVTPSESSDISSASADGLPKRKKSARVSFIPEPEVVGQVVSEQDPVGSPGKEKRSWLGLGKNKPPLTTIPSNDDMEELMKPRAPLPTFGSVRGGKPKEPVHKTASGPSSEAFSTSAYNETGISSDHAVGAILAQNALSKSANNEPLPPEVRSVDGVLSYSDDESEVTEHDDHVPAPTKTSMPPSAIDLSKAALVATPTTQSGTTQSSPSAVPMLAVSPPTPGADSKPDDQYLVVVPGGFPVSAESLARLDESNKLTRGKQNVPDEDTTDNDSIYSDAAEDPEEMERMGFGSIDAILESPVTPLPGRLASPQESPLANYPVQQAANTGDWEATQARWKGIAQQTREAPAPPQAINDSNQAATYNQVTMPTQQAPAAQAAPKPKRKKKSAAEIAALASVPTASRMVQAEPESPLRQRNQGSSYPTLDPGQGQQTVAAPTFRQSMRATSATDTDPVMRKSMRNEARKSAPPPVTSTPSAIATSQQSAAQTAMPPPQQPRAALQKKHIPLAKAAAATAPLPKPKPAPVPTTNDSDSDSSFRKARRSKPATGGKYTMRRSMRGATEPITRSDPRNGVRSVSPVGRRPMSPPSGAYSMRTSMRGSMDAAPTLRGSNDTKRSSSLFGRSQRTPAPPVLTSRTNRSRILDSDDEDDQPQPDKWRSRFADDSDDEDVEVPHFAPVRGIPRRNNGEDSTDLEDSSDEERPTPTKRSVPKLQIPQTAPAALSSNEPLSPNSEKKRGLFGLFKNKKPKEETLSPVVESPNDRIKPTTDTSKPSRLGFASNAERDRIIAETQAKLEAAKEDSRTPITQTASTTSSGKLQRRHMPERVMSDSWPLPPPIGDDKLRPNTADGQPIRNGTTRLNQGSMRVPNVPADAVGRSGKKKKFPMLRKAFGLKD